MPSFFEGFARGKGQAQDRALINEFKKTQVNKLKADLDAKEKALEAQTRFKDLLQPSSAPQGADITGAPIEGPPQAQQPGMTLTQALSDPQGQLAALQSGFADVGDIQQTQQQETINKLLSGFGGGTAPTGGTPTGAAPTGGVPMRQSVRISARGPEITMAPQKVKYIEVDDQLLPFDEQGNPVPGLKPIPKKAVVTQVVQTDEGPRIKTIEQRTGQEVADLGAPKPEKISAEQGGRITAAVTAEKNAADVRAAINETEGLDRRTLLSTMATAFPGSKGRELRFKMQDAADAVVRLRTGATANETELKQILEQFMPSPLDSNEGIEDKMNRFEAFIGGAIDITTLPPTLRKKIEKSRPGKKPSLDLGKKKQTDLTKMTDEQLQAIIDGR